MRDAIFCWRISSAAFIYAVVLCCVSVVHAWNGPGHQTIDLVAWQLLDDADQERAVALLMDHPRYDPHFTNKIPDAVWKYSQGGETRIKPEGSAEFRQWVFAHAGTWPDQIRSARDVVTRDDVRRFSRPTWHYINLHVYLSDADRAALAGKVHNNRETDPPRNPSDPGQNVVQAIKSSLKVLGDDNEDRATRAVALCWFLHLAGDSHQPMHSSAIFTPRLFPEGDRGGNEIPVRGAGGNLHSLWDGSILPGRTEYNRVRREALELVDEHEFDGKKAAAELDPKVWLVESWKLADKQAYAAPIREAVAGAETAAELVRVELPPDYLKEAGLASKRRAAEAGYRIAACLRGKLPEPVDRVSVFTMGSGVRELEPTEPPKPEAPSTASYWLNTSSNVRHNASCKNFEATKRGRFCGADEGKACGLCGG